MVAWTWRWVGFDEICTPISKLSFVAISNSKILKPKELTSQVSILLRLILLVSENRKYFEIFVNTHRWWRVDYGDKYILNGTSQIPVNFIKLSPPDHNMTTYLDRWDPHLSPYVFLCHYDKEKHKIYTFICTDSERKQSFRYQCTARHESEAPFIECSHTIFILTTIEPWLNKVNKNDNQTHWMSGIRNI